MTSTSTESLGFLEVTGFTPAIAALDVMEKCATIRLLQAEKNDFLGVCIKILGTTADVHAAVEAGREIAQRMGGKPVSNVINRPDPGAWPALESPPEVSPLIQQSVVLIPRKSKNDEQSNPDQPNDQQKEPHVAAESFALGMIETQGFTAVFEAIDSACKAANVEVLGKEKLGGGYITVIIKGDVAAVKAAIEAGQSKVEGLGKLIAAHVIPRPSQAVLGLLPK